MNKKRKKINATKLALILIVVIVLLSVMLSLFEVEASRTLISEGGMLETTIITVRSFFSKAGLASFVTMLFDNVAKFKDVIAFLVVIVGSDLAHKSGLFIHLFGNLKRFRIEVFVFVTVLLGVLLGFFGDLTYILLIPIISVIYKSANKNPIIGTLSTFLAVSFGYGFNLLFNSGELLLGSMMAQAAKTQVDPSYVFSYFNTIFMNIVFIVIIIVTLSVLISVFLVPKLAKYEVEELELKKSNKGLLLALVSLIIPIIFVVYGIIPKLPMSGYLLGSGATYLTRLISVNSPFIVGSPVILFISLLIASIIYGRYSRNIRNSNELNETVFKSLNKIGPFVILSLVFVQVISMFEWTNIGSVILIKLTDLLALVQFSGIPLIIMFFVIVVFGTLLIPSQLKKWDLMYPVIVPLFMRANISPDFALTIFKIGDSIGKVVTPLNIYLILTVGVMNNYKKFNNKKILFGDVIVVVLPIVVFMIIVLLFVIILWYVIGLPIGVGVYPIL